MSSTTKTFNRCESEATYHSLVECLPLNISRKGLDGRIVFSNQRTCEALGKLLDVQMPELDGLEVRRREHSQELRIPIIAMTAHAMKGDKERCLESGRDDDTFQADPGR